MKNIVIMLLVINALMSYEVDVPNKVSKHIVKIEDDRAMGTAFYVMYKGKSHLITNKHVCDDNKYMNIPEGKVKVIAVSKNHDLCLLESDRKDGLRFSNIELKPFVKVSVIGHPRGYPLTVREGRFVTQELALVYGDLLDMIHISVPAFGGNSGGPILDKYGHVLGVLFLSNAATEEDSYGVPKADLIRFLNTIN